MDVKKKIVMVFGVFDRLHDGHRSFLKQAQKHGERLIAVVARDSAVRALKNKIPSQAARQRMAILRKVSGVWKVVLGDRTQGTYAVIKKWKPDVVCVGYDQHTFFSNLHSHVKKGALPPLVFFQLKAYNPRVFHSSLEKI